MSIITVGWKRVEDSVREFFAPSKYKWNYIVDSVTGASHLARHLPNQDAVAVYPQDGPSSYIVLAVADGHSEVAHFRSDRGSRCAVNAAAEVITNWLRQPQRRSLSEVREAWERTLPSLLHAAWKNRIFGDLQANPFTDAEMARVPDGRLRDVAANCLVPYGTTILAVVATNAFVGALQLGDGDILAVDDDGTVRPLMPSDNSSFGEATDSLCDRSAPGRFRCFFETLEAKMPAAIMMATDGYEKSFPNHRGHFLKMGTDLLRYLRQYGPEKVREDLPVWLSSTSADGSGDDITLAVAYRVDAITGDSNGHVGRQPS